jgi:hypothetical protein
MPTRGVRVIGKLWVTASHNGHGLNGGLREVWRALTSGPCLVWRFFQHSKSSQTCKFKTDAFQCSKNNETLYAARAEYFEQPFQLGWLQTPNRIRVINFWTDSNLNLLWILKGFKPYGKNLRNLLGHTCMQEIYFQYKCQMTWFEYKKRVWIWNSNHTTLVIQTKPYKDFIQASKLHSELLFKHCSCYSDARGAIALPPNINLAPRFGSSGSNRSSE